MKYNKIGRKKMQEQNRNHNAEKETIQNPFEMKFNKKKFMFYSECSKLKTKMEKKTEVKQKEMNYYEKKR